MNSIVSKVFTQLARIVSLLTLVGVCHVSSAKKAPEPLPSDPRWIIPGIVGRQQEQQNWCWAAVDRAILSTRMNPLPSQCEIVSKVFKRDCCGVGGSQTDCNKGNDPRAGLDAYGVATWLRTPVYSAAVDWLKSGRPVILNIGVGGSDSLAGHAELAYGAYFTNQEYFLLVFDPYTGRSSSWTENQVMASAITFIYLK